MFIMVCEFYFHILLGPYNTSVSPLLLLLVYPPYCYCCSHVSPILLLLCLLHSNLSLPPYHSSYCVMSPKTFMLIIFDVAK